MDPLSGINTSTIASLATARSLGQKTAAEKVITTDSSQPWQHCDQKALSDYNIKPGENNVVYVGLKKTGLGGCSAKYLSSKKQQADLKHSSTNKDLEHDYRQNGQWSWSDIGVRIAGHPQCPVPQCVGHIPEGAMWNNYHWV